MGKDSKSNNDLNKEIIDLKNEIDLLKKEKKYSYLLKHSPGIIFIIKEDENIEYVSPSVEWLLGYSPKKLIGTNVFDFCHSDDIKKIRSVIKYTYLNKGHSFIIPESRAKHNNNSWIYFDGYMSNQMDNPEVNGFIFVFNDITQKKLVQMDYNRLVRAINISTDSFLLTDINNNIMYINNAAMNLYGTSDKKDIIGKNINEFIEKNDVDKLFDIKSLDKNQMEIRSVEHDFIGKGTVIRVESTISIMKDDEDINNGYIYNSKNITEKNKFKEELDQYKFLLEDLVKLRTVELNESMDKLGTTLEGFIQSMSLAIESKDPYTAGHQRRVAELSVEIAKMMNLETSVTDGIRMASLIHDLGKIYVPAEILTRPGHLDEIEFMLVKKHPQVGYDILKNINFPWPIAEIVYQHHEKIDGSGYPRGLKGDEILLEAQIICVADVVEAIANSRPYRVGLGIPVALQEISTYSGKLYNTEAVEACLKVFNETDFSFD